MSTALAQYLYKTDQVNSQVHCMRSAMHRLANMK